MTRLRNIACFVSIFTLLTGCGFFGIHLRVKNSLISGAYPRQNKARQLLARPDKKRDCFDVSYYRLDLSLISKRRFIKGSVLIVSKLLAASDTLQLDLYRNLKISRISLNGAPVNFTRQAGAIFIKTPASLRVSEQFSITVNYHGKPKRALRPPWRGGMVWKKDYSGRRWAGVACEGEGASLWWPNKDELSDEPDSADVNMTVPAKLELVSNGTFAGEKISSGNTKTVSWHISYPINNYNITFYLGNFKCLHDTFISSLNSDALPMRYYVLPRHEATAKAHLGQVKTYLAFYEKMFGPYPWPKDGFKLVESPYEGMEHQTAIAYGHKFKNGRRGFDYILLHETAHEWWGNSVSAADLSDVWLHEGFATYAEALYIEASRGREKYLDYMYELRLPIANMRPVVRPRGIRYFSVKDEDVYYKGAWVLHTLRNTIKNDSLFFDLLKTFRMQNHEKQIFTEDFIKLVNQKTGSDYSWFFKQYLYRREAPMLEYNRLGDYFYYRWKYTGADFNKLPVELNLGTEKKIVYPSAAIQKIKMQGAPTSEINSSAKEVYYGTLHNKRLKEE